MMMRGVFFGLGLLFALPAMAQKPQASVYGISQVALRANPMGLRSDNRVAWRKPLSSSEALLWKSTYLELGGTLAVTPVSLFPGLYVEVVPIAPIVLKAQTTQVTYLGVLGHALTFSQADLDAAAGSGAYWAPEVVAARTGDESGAVATGYDHMVSGTLQLKVGRVLAKGTLEHHWLRLNLPAGAARWYDSSNDLMMAPEDRLVVGKGLLAYLVFGGLSETRFLLVGTTYTYHRTQGDALQRHLGGLLAVWRPGWLPKRRLTTGLIAQRYMPDAAGHRSGEMVGFGFVQMRFGRTR
jgi:hypothetical protein